MLKVIISYYYYHFFLFVCLFFVFFVVVFLFSCFLFFAPNQNLSLDILNALLLVVLAHIKALFEKISYWAYQWKIQFNPDPTKHANEVIFSLKTSSNNNRPY